LTTKNIFITILAVNIDKCQKKGGDQVMAIVKFDPAKSWFSFPSWNDFDDTFQRGLKVRETDKDILIEAVVAGIPSENIEINIEDGILTIKAEKKDEKKEQSSFYSYYYTTALSGGEWDKAVADIENGVVIVRIPKEEKAKARKITIRAKAK
jgi:HSP20 family molecular chaperone IbpA